MTQPRSPTIRTVTQGNAGNRGDQLASRAARFVVVAAVMAEDRLSKPINRASKHPSAEPSRRMLHPRGLIAPVDSSSDRRAERCKPHRRDRGEV